MNEERIHAGGRGARKGERWPFIKAGWACNVFQLAKEMDNERE